MSNSSMVPPGFVPGEQSHCPAEPSGARGPDRATLGMSGDVSILGINGKFAAPDCDALNRPFPVDAAALSRLERFELQSVARRLMVGEEVCRCLRVPIPGSAAIPVYYIPSTGSACFGQLVTCGSVWMCPVCAAKISERRRAELEQAIKAWRDRAGAVAMLTLTFAHEVSDGLWELLESFLAAIRWMTSHRAFKRLRACYSITHTVRALEVTWGGEHGWHPHVHILLFLGRAPSIYRLQSELLCVWKAALERFGLTCDELHGVRLDVTAGSVADYVAKFGKQPARRAWGAEDELTKAHIKRGRGERFTPFDLLRWLRDTGEAEAAELFAHYACYFKGRHQLQWSRGARAALGLGIEKSDKEVADEVERDGLLLSLLEPEDFRLVRRYNQQGLLLEVARLNDVVALRSFLSSLREGIIYGL